MSYDSVSVSVARLHRLAVAVVETYLARLYKRTDRRNWKRERREGALVFVRYVHLWVSIQFSVSYLSCDQVDG